jgi:type II secretory pathway pseudopilin PulG
LREQSAFSLTEVVIAMGVAAVAFTSIIALFPLGLNMSKESYEATQAALIAQTILADLQDEGTGTNALGSSRFIQIGGNSDPTSPANYLTINFATAAPSRFIWPTTRSHGLITTLIPPANQSCFVLVLGLREPSPLGILLEATALLC